MPKWVNKGHIDAKTDGQSDSVIDRYRVTNLAFTFSSRFA